MRKYGNYKKHKKTLLQFASTTFGILKRAALAILVAYIYVAISFSHATVFSTEKVIWVIYQRSLLFILTLSINHTVKLTLLPFQIHLKLIALLSTGPYYFFKKTIIQLGRSTIKPETESNFAVFAKMIPFFEAFDPFVKDFAEFAKRILKKVATIFTNLPSLKKYLHYWSRLKKVVQHKTLIRYENSWPRPTHGIYKASNSSRRASNYCLYYSTPAQD